MNKQTRIGNLQFSVVSIADVTLAAPPASAAEPASRRRYIADNTSPFLTDYNSSRIVKITYYSKYSDQGPSSRYRAFQFIDAFRKTGVDFQIENLFDNDFFDILRMPDSFSKTLRKAKYILSRFRTRKKKLRNVSADLCVIEGQLFPYAPFLWERRSLPRNFLVEFDDAIYLTHPMKFPRLLKSAAGVIVGNPTLADYAKNYNEHVHVVPTVLNTDTFRPLPKTASEKIRVGWTGLEYNFKYLRMLTPVLWKISQKFPVEIVILSSSSPRNLAFPFRFEKWDPGKEAEQINQFDIGVMPLEMDEWCKGKCGFKLLQYMSLGIPAVATPVGVNEEIVQNGVNGFTAVGLEQWEEALAALINDSHMRGQIGAAARKTVVESYSAEVWFPRLLDIYTQYSR